MRRAPLMKVLLNTLTSIWQNKGLLAVCLACGSGKTVLKGHIDNYNGETVSIVPMDDYDSRDTLQVDASGNFAYAPANEESQEYVLSVHGFAPYNNCIYLGTGDQVEVNFVLSPDKTMEVQFAGDRAAENEYLQAFDAFQNSRMGYDQDMLALPFAAYKAKFDEKEQELQALLDKVADSELGICPRTALVFPGALLELQLCAFFPCEERGEGFGRGFCCFCEVGRRE